MSAESNLANIHRLGSAISQFKSVLGDLSGMNFDDLKSAGTHQWAGQKKTQFDQDFGDAKSSWKNAQNQIQDAINDCRGRQVSLASAIDSFEHPIISAEAWAAIGEGFF